MGSQPEPRATNPAPWDLVSALLAVVMIGGWLLFAVALVAGNVIAIVGWAGPDLNALGFLGVADLLLLGLMGKVTVGLMRIAEKHERKRKYGRREPTCGCREHPYGICAHGYIGAPREIRDTMQRLFASAEALRATRAYREGMFGDIDVGPALRSAARRAAQAAEISMSKRRLEAAAGSADKDALRRATVALRKIDRLLDKAEAELGKAVTTAKELSEKLAATERARVAAREEERAAARRRAAQAKAERTLARVENATAQAKSTTKIDTTEIVDRVNAVAAGYDEARRVSDNIRRGPRGTAGST